MSNGMDEFDNMISEYTKNKYARESNPDLLDRSEIIKEISEIIDEHLFSKDPLSLAITGLWGVGKSFILKKIEEIYSNKCIVLYFDCWKKDFYEDPLMGILSSVSEKINELEDENPDNQQAHYYRVMKEVIFQISRGIVQHFTNFDLEKIRNNFTNIKDLVKTKKKLEIESFDSLSNISDAIEIVNNLLCGYMAYEGKKILFIVDELDRCLPDYAIKVLNRLHHICEGTPLIQLVAINDRELKHNINGIYRRDLNSSFSRRYLQRFFSDFYRIPIGNSDKLIDSCWRNIDDYFEGNESKKLFSYVCSYSLWEFPIREKKRIINLLQEYHKKKKRTSDGKYPYELASAELLELIRIFLSISQNWIITKDICEEDAFIDVDADDDGTLYPIYMSMPYSIKFNSKQSLETPYDSEICRYLVTDANDKSTDEFIQAKNFIKALLVKDYFYVPDADQPTQPNDSEETKIPFLSLKDENFQKCFEALQEFKTKLESYK